MKRCNFKFKWYTLILVLLILCLTGYILYDKLVNSNNNISINYNYTTKNRKNVQTLHDDYVEILVDLNGDVYLSVIGNIDNIEDKQIKNSLFYLKNSLSNYTPKGYTDYTGQSSIYNSKKLNISNVLTSYHVLMGNGADDYFIFIKENGTLSYLKINLEAGTIPIFNIEKLNNIVTIVENDYTKSPYAVDLEGNEYSLYDYIIHQ